MITMERVVSQSPNSYVPALTPRVMVFRDRAFREKLRINEGFGVGIQSNGTDVL